MQKKKAIERARKLMAMAADSASPNEAAIAARRARSIIDEHQLTGIDLEDSAEFGESSVGRPRKKVPRWEQGLCIDIAKLNDCIAKFDEHGKFIFQGFAEDAEVCKFMFFYLSENCKRTCKSYIKVNPLGCRNSFKLGYVYTIRQKIKNIIESRRNEFVGATGKSLCVIKKSLVENNFGNEKYRKASPVTPSDPLSSYAGQKAAENTNIVTGVHADQRTAIA